MNTQVKQAKNQSESVAPSADNSKALTDAAASKAAEVAKLNAAVDAEIKAITDAESALESAVKATGHQGMERLAVAVGESITEAGRPAFAPWLRLVTALALRKADYAKQDQLLGIVRKTARETLEVSGEGYTDDEIAKIVGKLVKSKASASFGSASCKLSLNAPARWEIALGN